MGYRVPGDGVVTLVVYDVRGAEVARLAEGFRSEGEYEAAWDGRDLRGRTAAPGVYFARLETPGGSRVRKIVKQSPER